MTSLDTETHKLFFVYLLFSIFKKNVKPFLKKRDGDSGPTVGYYTPHDESHILGVETSIRKLLDLQEHETEKKGKQDVKVTEGPANIKGDSREILIKNNPLEFLLLKFCAWGHDLGMVKEVAEEFAATQSKSHKSNRSITEQYRDDHDNASAFYIRKELPKFIYTLHDELKFGRKLQDVGKLTNPAEIVEEIKEILKSFTEADTSEEKIEEFVVFIKNDSNLDYLRAEAFVLANTINLISKYHRRSEKIALCPEERYLLENPIRTKLLAAIFRLADALHIDHTRFSRDAFDAYRDSPFFTEENRTHWIKSFIISSIRVDTQNNTINVQADLPAENDLDMSQNPDLYSTNKINEMLKFVEMDLEEDLLSVSRILLDHEFPPILGVKVETHIIPEMGYSEEIKASLDNLLAAASPNTSQLIEIAMNRLTDKLELAKSNFNKQLEEKLKDFAQRQISVLEQQLQKRPCHEGLRKIKDLLYCVSQLWIDMQYKTNMNCLSSKLRESSNEEGDSRLIWTLLESLYKVFMEQRDRVVEGAKSDKIKKLFKDCTDIIVYGYSQQVIEILRNVFSEQKKIEDRPDIHVLECRTKTLYTSTGQLIYLDAQRYAERLKHKLQYIGKISIEPDVAIGHIIQHTKPNKSTIILLGSNAVYEDGRFVHSMGHLTIAAVAQAECLGKAEVIVVSDGMKIGTQPRNKKDDERNQEKWLTPNQDIINGFRKNGILLHNWQEDEVPSELIHKLIVLDTEGILEGSVLNDGIKPETGINCRTQEEVSAHKFNQRENYCNKLECRILAAVISKTSKDSKIQEDISIFSNSRPENTPESEDIQNWLCAEDFLKGKDNSELSETLWNWINKLWGEDGKKSVIALTKAILNMAEQEDKNSANKEPSVK